MRSEPITRAMERAAAAIRVARARQDVTQEELAERAEITPQFLCRLENARKTASLETYANIAEALHIQLSDLFREDKPIPLSDQEQLAKLLASCSAPELRVCAAAVEGILAAMRQGTSAALRS